MFILIHCAYEDSAGGGDGVCMCVCGGGKEVS